MITDLYAAKCIAHKGQHNKLDKSSLKVQLNS